jgi:hypothetical protein
MAAREEPGLVIRRGVQVTALTGGAPKISGIPHVTGVVAGSLSSLRAR